MNKSALIESVAKAADITKVDAGKAINALISVISKALKNDDVVTLQGFGTFKVRARAARTGSNPRTGKAIKIAARKTLSFKASKILKDTLNK